ncbi:MAG: hypothetical protein LC808_20830 [Actinobacteria bacterium]|nr:hypothetical protein [Actinomycetota bacterium]
MRSKTRDSQEMREDEPSRNIPASKENRRVCVQLRVLDLLLVVTEEGG